MKRTPIALLALAITLVITPVVRAESFSYTWVGIGVFQVDAVDVFTETPGVTFTNPGLTALNPGWTDRNVNPWFSSASGATSSSLTFTTNVTGVENETYTLDLYGLLAGVVASSTSATYSDGVWSFGNAKGIQRENITATPEPVTLLLFGTGLAGIGGFMRRRFSL